MRQNREDEAKTATGWNLRKCTGNLRYIVRLIAAIHDQDTAGSAPIGAQSLTKWSDGRDYCALHKRDAATVPPTNQRRWRETRRAGSRSQATLSPYSAMHFECFGSLKLEISGEKGLLCNTIAGEAFAWNVNIQNSWQVHDECRKTVSTAITKVDDREQTDAPSHQEEGFLVGSVGSKRTYWKLRRGVCETMEMKEINCQKSLFYFKANALEGFSEHQLRTSSAHGIWRKIETVYSQLCTQIELPIQGTVTLQKVSAVKRSWSYRRYYIPRVR